MKIQLMSDLHLFHQKNRGADFIKDLDPTDVDVLVLAGDIGELSDISFAIPLFCKKYKNVVMCQGNHSFYRSNKEAVEKETQLLVKEFPNLHYLNNSLVEIDGQRFLGGTLWFKRTNTAQKLEREFSDFHDIEDLSSWVYKDNLDFRMFLKDNLKENDIVVSHHLPSEKCGDPKYFGDPFNCFFICDIEEIIKERKPKYYFHGHTHIPVSTEIGSTKVLCNPYGYTYRDGSKEHNKFNYKLVIEV